MLLNLITFVQSTDSQALSDRLAGGPSQKAPDQPSDVHPQACDEHVGGSTSG